MEQELAAVRLPDARLEKRLQHLVEQMAAGLGRSIPLACQDWAATKAAYRFFSNERICEEQILSGHFEATRERLPRAEVPVLVLHDTTEFTYKREDMAAVGLVSKGSVRKDEHGRPVYFTTCGVCLHSSLAVTLEGLPLGLTAIKFWSRKAFKGQAAKRKAHNAPIEKKESMRWLENLRASTALLAQPARAVHVGDQESDIFDLFAVVRQLETHFLVRTRADRLADGGPETVAEAIGQSPRRGLYRIAVRNRKGEPSQAELEIRYQRLRLQTPKGKKKRYPDQIVTVIEAREQQTPPDRDRIDWKLITDLEVGSLDLAIEKVQWYATALEDRGLSQNPEIWLQSRTVASENQRAANQSAGCVLHPQLACLLAHHDQSHRAGRCSRACLHGLGTAHPRPISQRQTQRRPRPTCARALPD